MRLLTTTPFYRDSRVAEKVRKRGFGSEHGRALRYFRSIAVKGHMR
jgi:hypothetical protein